MAKAMPQVDPGFDAGLKRIAIALSLVRKVVVIMGAGVSTAAGIPDFRSKTGLQDIFSNDALRDSEGRARLLSVALELHQRATQAEPTDTHKFIRTLRDRGQLLRCYTQNIDMIEAKAGLSIDVDADAECIPLHGSLRYLRCQLCRGTFNWDEYEAAIHAEDDLPCPKCQHACRERTGKGLRSISIGRLLPDIALLDAEHNEGETIAEIINRDVAADPDLLLMLGTSLCISGPKKLAYTFARVVNARGGMVVYTNLSKPSLHPWGRLVDYVVEGTSDSWVMDLVRRLSTWRAGLRLRIEGSCERRGKRKRHRGRGHKERIRKGRFGEEKKQDGSAEYPFIVD